MTALFVPHLMKEFAWVRGYQLVQAKLGGVTVRYIADGDVTAMMTAPLGVLLREKLGDATTVVFERVNELRKSKSGKTPIVVVASDGAGNNLTT